MNYFSPHLLDGSVTTVKLADDAVTRSKIIDAAIGSAQLGPGSVTSSRMAGGAVGHWQLNTAEGSIAGSIPADDTFHVVMTAFCFWPMFHVSNWEALRVSGHETDGGSVDLPRFSIDNTTGSPHTYDVDYRYVVV